MGKIEELPDDFDERINLNEQPLPSTAHAPQPQSATSHNEDASMDDLYEQAVARGGLTDKTFEEALSDLSKTPLFMTSLEGAGDESTPTTPTYQRHG